MGKKKKSHDGSGDWNSHYVQPMMMQKQKNATYFWKMFAKSNVFLEIVIMKWTIFS